MTLLLPPRHGQREDAGDAAGCSHRPGELESARPDNRVTTTDGDFSSESLVPSHSRAVSAKRSADSEGPTRMDRAGYRNTPSTAGSGRGPCAATTGFGKAGARPGRRRGSEPGGSGPRGGPGHSSRRSLGRGGGGAVRGNGWSPATHPRPGPTPRTHALGPVRPLTL